MIESCVPTSFWPEAIATATYLANRLPTKILNFHTPIQTLSTYTQVPQALVLTPHIFGCSIFVHIPKTERTKLDSHSCHHGMRFLGNRVLLLKNYPIHCPRGEHNRAIGLVISYTPNTSIYSL